MPRERPRIAIVGIILESNRFAPPTRLKDFHDYLFLEGDAILPLVESMGFTQAISSEIDWEPAPVMVAAAESGGPLLHEDYLDLLSRIESRLRKCAPVDAVFIFGHGAGMTTQLDDLDGDYFYRIRDLVGPNVPIVAELDLHANLSEAMVSAADLLVGYRTNPHVDTAAIAVECANALVHLLRGRPVMVAYQRVPLVTPQIAQLTALGTPYGALIDEVNTLLKQPLYAGITLLSGFAFGDAPFGGFAVYVATWGDLSVAEQTCNRLAEAVWSRRSEFNARGISIPEAIDIEVNAEATGMASPRIYADIADNPGGGGRGNTIHLLRAMAEAPVRGVQAAAWFDPALVKAARAAGEGKLFEAGFNQGEISGSSGTWATEARVERICDITFRSEMGVSAGNTVNLGACAVLALAHDRIKVVVCSLRNQVFSPEFFRHAGLDPAQAQALIVKSRGHFRAGFASLATPGNIFEVDGPGLTAADLNQLSWLHLTPDMFPDNPAPPWRPRALLRGSKNHE